MPKENTAHRRRVQPDAAGAVQPVARRLFRIEALLIEMRYEQDVQLKRITALQAQLDTLDEHVSRNSRLPETRTRRR
jgi:hypothetical protein